MQKINLKAQSHVEIMISFVIFIGFLIFIFIFLNPFAKTAEQDYAINNAQKAIISNISETIGKLSIITNGTSCYQFIDNNYNGNYTEVSQGNGKYIIYFNKNFLKNAPHKNTCTLNYTLGVYSEEKMILEYKIKELKANYEAENNYENLKHSLGINNNFLFKIKDLNGNEKNELSVNKTIPKTINIHSIDMPIRIINNSGNIEERILNIKVW